MNEKIRMENKKEDKKQFRRFIITLCVAFLVGIVMGIVIAVAEDAQSLPTTISQTVYTVVTGIAPYAGVAFCLIAAVVIVIAKTKVKAMIKAWDGEDEDAYQKMDNMLGNALTVLNVGVIVVYFFFAVGFEGLPVHTGFEDICYFLGFVLSLVIITVGQQVIIGMTKEINPEKKGSIYDKNFVDKWEDSCDEAEKILIYKSAYKTYTKMSGLFVALWVFCIFGNGIFKFGLMPVTVLSLLWLCNVCIYTYYSKYYEKHPDKIGVFK